MFLGNEETVYILDKAEGNAAQINGHPAWGAAWYNSFLSLVFSPEASHSGISTLIPQLSWT